MNRLGLAAMLAVSLALPATGAAQERKQQAECGEAVQLFRSTDQDMARFFESAVGYAIFPSVGKGAFIVGGAAGTGCLYEGHAITGQAYAEIIFFQTPDALASFKSSSFEMSVQVSAVAAAEPLKD